MKINEIVIESKLRKGAVRAVPGMKKHPDLTSSDPYKAYKFGVALAGSPDFVQEADQDGPSGQALVTIGYTDACEAIIKATEKKFGVKSQQMTPRGSQELKSVHKTSPVPTRKKNKYGV